MRKSDINRSIPSQSSHDPEWRKTADILADACYRFYKFRETKSRFIKATEDQERDQAFFNANPKSKAASDFSLQKARESYDQTKKEWQDTREIFSGELNNLVNTISSSIREELQLILKQENPITHRGKQDLPFVEEEFKKANNNLQILQNRVQVFEKKIEERYPDQNKMHHIQREQSLLSQRIDQVERQLQTISQTDSVELFELKEAFSKISNVISTLTPIIDEHAHSINELQDTTTAYHREIGSLPPGEHPDDRETILSTLRKIQQSLNNLNDQMNAPGNGVVCQLKMVSGSMDERFTSLQDTSWTSQQISATRDEVDRLKRWIDSRDKELDCYIDDVQKELQGNIEMAVRVPSPFVDLKSAIEEILRRIEALNSAFIDIPYRHTMDMKNLENQIRQEIERIIIPPADAVQTSSDLKAWVGYFNEFERRLRSVEDDIGKVRNEIYEMKHNLENLYNVIIKSDSSLIGRSSKVSIIKEETDRRG